MEEIFQDERKDPITGFSATKIALIQKMKEVSKIQ